MYDINFYRQIFSHELKTLKDFNSLRCSYPTIFGIETTNDCNQKCFFCPRGRGEMTRETITDKSLSTIKKILPYLRTWSNSDWNKWKLFVSYYYNISENEMNENHFYLYILSRVIVLHGWGDPLLDPSLNLKIQLLKDFGFETYFSCNPSNIDIKKCKQLFLNGLTYIKFSIDSLIKNIRGNQSSFLENYNKIIELNKFIKEKQLNSKIIITMIDLGQKEWDQLHQYFTEDNFYMYLKNQNSQKKSIHWTTPCLFPWYACSIHSNENVVLCQEDFNDSLILGNLKQNTLQEIWNNEISNNYRIMHFNNSCQYCKKNCDMKMIGEKLNYEPF